MLTILKRIPLASAALFALTALILYGTQVSLQRLGWFQAFSAKPARTGFLLLDVLIEMFLQTIGDASGSSAWFLISGMAPIASNLVIFEGSRRRGSFNQVLLAAYWWMSQFIAIGVATPLFLGLYLMKPKRNEELVDVGTWRASVSLIALIGSSGMGVMLEQSVHSGHEISVLLVASFCLFPVLLVSGAVLLDRSSSNSTVSGNGQRLALLTYGLSAVMGMIMHARLLMLFMKEQFSFDLFMLNSPAVSLGVDVLGVFLSVYAWFLVEGKVSVFEQWPLFFLGGPAVHVSYLVYKRESAIYDSLNVHTD